MDVILRKYKSHKVVEAAKIVDVELSDRCALVLDTGGTVSPPPKWVDRMVVDRPAEQWIGGYYVDYGDYASWSPADKFEEGYTLIDNSADKSDVNFEGWTISEEQIKEDPILRFFAFSHLKQPLRDVSKMFAVLAAGVVTDTPRNAERTVALRKLLEAKDAAVRAALP